MRYSHISLILQTLEREQMKASIYVKLESASKIETYPEYSIAINIYDLANIERRVSEFILIRQVFMKKMLLMWRCIDPEYQYRSSKVQWKFMM